MKFSLVLARRQKSQQRISKPKQIKTKESVWIYTTRGKWVNVFSSFGWTEPFTFIKHIWVRIKMPWKDTEKQLCIQTSRQAPWKNGRTLDKVKENLILQKDGKREKRQTDRQADRKIKREWLEILNMFCWWIQKWISSNWDKMQQTWNYSVVEQMS